MYQKGSKSNATYLHWFNSTCAKKRLWNCVTIFSPSKSINENTAKLHGYLTFNIKLSMNDVTHYGCIVQVLDCVLGTSGAGKQHPSQAQVLFRLGVKQNFHLFHLPKLGTHVCQEGFFNIVIESSECHLLERNRTHVKLIKLSMRNGIINISHRWRRNFVRGLNILVILTLNFGTGKDNSAYLDHNLRGLGSRNSPTGGNPESWNILQTGAQKPLKVNLKH